MKRVIAIIDDDETLLAILKTVLEEEGYIVKPYSHTIFIDVLEEDSYDLLLLDVWFDTYRAGVEMAQAINNRAKLMNKPVIMMSSDPNLQEYAKRAGVTNYLSKPINFETLLEVVSSLFNNKKTTQLSPETEAYNRSHELI